uniref:Cholesteryl ester transfer protein n=1 Tax=Seriola dumerili TaxID=41447 RepID=A0A3B4TEJ0_SERDU
MTRDVFPPPLLLLLFLSVFGTSHGCLQDPVSAYRLTGAVCRLTYPAAVVLNEKTTKVIEAAFQHAKYPSVKGEKSLLFIGRVTYGLENLEIHNLSIGRSAFELHAGEGISMEISNVSAVFRGTIQYGYGNLLRLTSYFLRSVLCYLSYLLSPLSDCGEGKVAADTSDCYLNFHKLHLHLQGDREPNWLKKLFTDFITFTVKLVIKGQICKEINKVANILADFIQDTAEDFLSDGDISMDIGVTAAPVITANYIESYHKGLTKYNNTSAVISDSVFHPSQLTENRMLYFWLSDQVLNPLLAAAHQDGRFQLNISGAEITCLLESGSPELRVWSSSLPFLNTSTLGTAVWVQASGQLTCGSQSTPTLFFQTVLVPVYLFIHLSFIREAVEKIGIPRVLSVLEVELTRLLDKQGTNLFDIYDPEVLPRDGFLVIQMDFGFPHHLLVEFLQRTLQ